MLNIPSFPLFSHPPWICVEQRVQEMCVSVVARGEQKLQLHFQCRRIMFCEEAEMLSRCVTLIVSDSLKMFRATFFNRLWLWMVQRKIPKWSDISNRLLLHYRDASIHVLFTGYLCAIFHFLFLAPQRYPLLSSSSSSSCKRHRKHPLLWLMWQVKVKNNVNFFPASLARCAL